MYMYMYIYSYILYMPQNYADIREKLLLRLRTLGFTERTTKKEIKRIEAVLSSISNIADRKRQQNHAAAALLREVRERERERAREREKERARASERERRSISMYSLRQTSLKRVCVMHELIRLQNVDSIISKQEAD